MYFWGKNLDGNCSYIPKKINAFYNVINISMNNDNCLFACDNGNIYACGKNKEG